jgi:hypothetical protein
MRGGTSEAGFLESDRQPPAGIGAYRAAWEEQSGLPVHRVMKDKGSSVFAWQDEVDQWWRSRLIAPDACDLPGEPDAEEQTAPDPAPSSPPPAPSTRRTGRRAPWSR